MKRMLFIFVLILTSSCSSSKVINASTNNVDSAKTPEDPEILVGQHNRSALEQEPFSSWFNTNYKEYSFDTATVKKLSPYLKNITIKAFMGTWCGDSKRETPAFYKILDNASFDFENLELITVSRDKDTPQGFEKGANIMRVPTFIFYKDGKEIGRYVEFARETLEKDILAIVSNQSYKHSYED